MSNKILQENLFENQVVRIALNSPKGNVLDSSMMSELQAVLDSLKNQPQVKLVQFIGEGKHFSFGASVEEHTKENVSQMLKQFHQLFYTLIELSIPTMAIVTGQCLGGGMELALSCNFIFADNTAKFGQPEIALAVFAPPASLILPMKLGQSYADELLLTGKIINADEAHRIGLVCSISDDKESLLNAVNVWTTKNILPKSASSLKHANQAARCIFNETLLKQLPKLEKQYVNDLMETKDANEGINSFLEKRKPIWGNS